MCVLHSNFYIVAKRKRLLSFSVSNRHEEVPLTLTYKALADYLCGLMNGPWQRRNGCEHDLQGRHGVKFLTSEEEAKV
jgi:hypothetical protein